MNLRLAVGDVEGHPFHGNQWTGGAGSDDQGGDWNTGPHGERPYSWTRPELSVVPEIQHKVSRTNADGMWGYSHGNSQVITGLAAYQMGIPGYIGSKDEELNPDVKPLVEKFLSRIAEDKAGAEEVLHHSFENVRGTQFKAGDTMRLPLTATSGDIGGYGVRLDAEDQQGQPTIFEFEKGTQMMAYSTMSRKDAVEELGHKDVASALKERGYIWDEAIVAGGFKIVDVKDHVYMGSQHTRTQQGGMRQLYGQVIRLRQTETFTPGKGWSKRG